MHVSFASFRYCPRVWTDETIQGDIKVYFYIVVSFDEASCDSCLVLLSLFLSPPSLLFVP